MSRGEERKRRGDGRTAVAGSTRLIRVCVHVVTSGYFAAKSTPQKKGFQDTMFEQGW